MQKIINYVSRQKMFCYRFLLCHQTITVNNEVWGTNHLLERYLYSKCYIFITRYETQNNLIGERNWYHYFFRLTIQENYAHLVCILHKFRNYANKYECHTSASDTSIKKRVPRRLFIETRNNVPIFYQWVVRDGLNLRWMWPHNYSIVNVFPKGHILWKDSEMIQEDGQCNP